MAVYLRDHPPRTQQYRCPRRRNPSGIIGVHTAESFADEDGHDSSAEGVASFISRRTNYGSYHLIVDSDSIIQLVDFDCVAYHIGTHSLNEHTIGISAAVQAHEWRDYGDDYEDAVLRNMARAAAQAARWLQREHGITVPARRISLSEALRGERGFLAHGDADPERRTDPGSLFRWDRFLHYYAAEMAGDLEDDMPLNDADKQWLHDHIGPGAVNNNRTGRPVGQLLVELHQDLAGAVVTHPEGRDPESIRWALNRIRSTGNTLRDQIARVLVNQQAIMQSQGVEVDEQALAAQIAAVLVPAVVAEVSDATSDELEAAIGRVLERLRVTVDS